MSDGLIVVDDLVAGYSGRRGPAILHGVSLTLPEGGSLALVGESGSGKSTLAKVITGQLVAQSGHVLVRGVDRTHARGAERRRLRRDVQMVPQDPYGSLNPRRRIGDTIAEALRPGQLNTRGSEARIAELLALVSLPADAAGRYPHEFSGGQRQRIAIARALAVDPSVIVADEVTSALDASVQAEVLDLMRSLHAQGRTFVFVTHDLEIARYMCDSIVVLQSGRVVESGGIDLLDNPKSEYTRNLVASVPDPYGAFLGDV
ncbi:ABC transporter ATP-binding protein [Microbacterium sp. NPDC055357]